MTKPLVTFADPERAVVDFYLTAGIADTVSNAFPTTDLTGDAKHLQVELESGGAEDYPVTERAQVRVTCYTAPGKRTAVKSLASLAQGHLYAWEGDADVAGTVPLIGRSDVIVDPATKNLMVWFTFRVDMKPAVAAL